MWLSDDDHLSSEYYLEELFFELMQRKLDLCFSGI